MPSVQFGLAALLSVTGKRLLACSKVELFPRLVAYRGVSPG
ncbi:MAG: hypothetical protein WBA57_18375 [Elainellaceae cyanobacterium]